MLAPGRPGPPPPGPKRVPWISWAGGYGYGVAVVLCCGGCGAVGHGRVRAGWGGCPGAVAGWLFMVGGSWVVYYVRSPHHRQPFRKCPRCFPTPSSSKRTYVTGYSNSSFGHIIPRQTGCTSSSKRTWASRRDMSIGRGRRRLSERKHADIVSCTLTLPKYHSHGGGRL